MPLMIRMDPHRIAIADWVLFAAIFIVTFAVIAAHG